MMNVRQRRTVNIRRSNSQPPTQYLGILGLVFVAFLIWLWLYSPGAREGSTIPARRPASAEVREWLADNGLQTLGMDPNIAGEFIIGGNMRLCGVLIAKTFMPNVNTAFT